MNNYMTMKRITWKKWQILRNIQSSKTEPEETEIMNNPITRTELEAEIKNLPKNKAQDQMASEENSIKHLVRS